MTKVSIAGTEFLIDGTPTYAGRTYEGKKIQGLLFNVRAVQATFDDANPETRRHWTYPDTGFWDPDRNTDDFCAALPIWKAHGVLGFTVNFQGGGPLYVPEVYKAYDNNAFTPQGALKRDYARRMKRVLDRADELGMVAMVGLFYWVMLNKMENEAAIWRAADEALAMLEATGHRNILVELANEVDVVVDHTPYGSIFGWDRVHEMLERLRAAHPSLLYSTSGGGVKLNPNRSIPSERLIQAADYVLFHGNGTRPPELEAAIHYIKALPAFQANPKPLVINEDSPAVPNMEVCWPNYVSWGYYDQGFEGQGDDPYLWYGDRPRWAQGPLEMLNGFQTPPVNWGINSAFKQRFFERVAEITGAPGV
jgi:hypothetical protein